jgi:hypothetical protein
VDIGLFSTNITGILFVARKDASVSVYALYPNGEKIEHTEAIKLDPPITALSLLFDERVIATFVSNIQPGELVDPVFMYHGGFVDKKKKIWPVISEDNRIKDLLNRAIERLIERVGYSVDTLQHDHLDWSGEYE